jgi:hypothetical protein
MNQSLTSSKNFLRDREQSTLTPLNRKLFSNLLQQYIAANRTECFHWQEIKANGWNDYAGKCLDEQRELTSDLHAAIMAIVNRNKDNETKIHALAALMDLNNAMYDRYQKIQNRQDITWMLQENIYNAANHLYCVMYA